MINALDTLYGDEEIQIPKIDIETDPDLVHTNSFVKQSPEVSEINQEVVPSAVAPTWADGFNGQDCRPRLKTDIDTFLLDTGSMACVILPEAGDKIDKSITLKTVDGSPFPCYGKKTISFKMGRKTYHIEAFKAEVKTPLLGWDFVRKYRLKA